MCLLHPSSWPIPEEPSGLRQRPGRLGWAQSGQHFLPQGAEGAGWRSQTGGQEADSDIPGLSLAYDHVAFSLENALKKKQKNGIAAHGDSQPDAHFSRTFSGMAS